MRARSASAAGSLAGALGCLRSGDLDGAERALRAILRQRPGLPGALHLLGCVELKRGRPEVAIRRLRQAVTAVPMEPTYRENLAEAYLRLGRPEQAEVECRRVLVAAPDRPRALNLIGRIAMERREWPQALESLSAALRAQPSNLEAMLNLSVACNRIGEYALGRDYATLALRVAPGHPAAQINLGMAHKGLGQLREARAAFLAAGESAMARFNVGFVDLLEGHLAQGLERYEARRTLAALDRELGPRSWRGEPQPSATLLVHHEQGLGDTILASRFLPACADRFARVIVCVPRALARVIRAIDPRLEVVESPRDARWDVWAPAMSLAWLLGVRDWAGIPVEPWLRVSRPANSSSRPRVGLNWAGNPAYAYDHVRSTRLDAFAPLLDIPNVEWVSLHRGHLEHEAAERGLPQPLADARDFLDTAHVLASLDLVVSTETAVPNLAGAMGLPTCVVTGVDVDWRWRGWYPSVEVCAQERSGDWSAPLAKVRARVEALAAGAPGSRLLPSRRLGPPD